MTFPDPKLGVCVCKHIFEDSRRVRLVLRYSDGDWGFFCGENDHDDQFHWVGIEHLLERDPSLQAVSNLQKGYIAERTNVNTSWEIKKNPSI